MKKVRAPNERIKREYFIYLKEARGRSEASIDSIAKALNRFESYTKFRDFKAFRIEQAKAFKAHLAEQTNLRTGVRLSTATLYSTLGTLKAFFQWLAGRSGYKSRISYADAEYFNLSEKEARIATAHRGKEVPTVEQIRHVITSMPTQTDIEKTQPCLDRIHSAHRRPRWGYRLVQIEAYRCGLRQNRPRRPRGENQAGQDIHDMLFPSRR
jgi:integrase/recombinase XerD